MAKSRVAQPGVLIQGRGDEGLVGIEQTGTNLRPAADEAVVLDRPPDGVGMDAEHAGDGADAPMLGVEEAANLGVLLGRDHRGPSSPSGAAGPRPEMGQGLVTHEAPATATAGAARSAWAPSSSSPGVDGGLGDDTETVRRVVERGEV